MGVAVELEPHDTINDNNNKTNSQILVRALTLADSADDDDNNDNDSSDDNNNDNNNNSNKCNDSNYVGGGLLSYDINKGRNSDRNIHKTNTNTDTTLDNNIFSDNLQPKIRMQPIVHEAQNLL